MGPQLRGLRLRPLWRAIAGDDPELSFLVVFFWRRLRIAERAFHGMLHAAPLPLRQPDGLCPTSALKARLNEATSA